MTKARDFKRVVRARAAKTGESYTAARTSLIKQASSDRTAYYSPPAALATEPNADSGSAAPAPGNFAPAASVSPSDYARVAGMSDEAVKAKTGCAWEKWIKSLDHVNAHAWPHREIARYVHETYKVPGWWAQTITVGYERVRGLRETGQRRSGEYEISRSRTFDVGVGTLYKLAREPRRRARWMPGVQLALRSATLDKVARFTLVEDGTSVEMRVERKGRGRATLVVQHARIGSREAAERWKGWWGERLSDAALVLATPRPAEARRTRKTRVGAE